MTETGKSLGEYQPAPKPTRTRREIPLACLYRRYLRVCVSEFVKEAHSVKGHDAEAIRDNSKHLSHNVDILGFSLLHQLSLSKQSECLLLVLILPRSYIDVSYGIGRDYRNGIFSWKFDRHLTGMGRMILTKECQSNTSELTASSISGQDSGCMT
jgi:hypothetical protein